MRAALIAVALAMLVPAAQATPSQDLDAAKKAFHDGQLAQALPLYNALLYPPPPKLADATEIVDAYVNLGVCRVDAGDIDGAKREFEKALGLDPNKQLDAQFIQNKEAIRLFDDTKADLRNRAREAADKQKLAELLQEREAFKKSLVVYQSHPFGLNLIPFGFGQYQNGDTGKSILFASSELVTLGTSVGIWYYLVNKYGINNQHLHVDSTEAANIRLMQQVEIGSGAAFIVLLLWGEYDSYRNYKPQVRMQADDSLLPPNLRDIDKSHRPKKTSFHVVPMITPSGAGIGVGWEH
ncbi:MAG: hypothetical protein ACM31C_23655 [Acidobacteriota bacterium]